MSDQHAPTHDYMPSGAACQREQTPPEAAAARGHSNTPVQMTPSQKGLAVYDGLILDWLSGTFLRISQEEAFQFIDIFFGEMKPIDGAWGGYEHQAIILGKGRVRWSDLRPELGVHIDLGAEALSNLPLVGTIVGSETARGWLKDLLSLGFRPTRTDLAVDDRAGLLKLDRIREHITQDWLSTRFRKVKAVENLKGSEGTTIYFGSNKSDTVCRIYDKAAEQGVEGHWVRCEFQFRHKNAIQVCERIVDEGESCAFGLFRGYLDFKEGESNDTNVTRRPTAAWWAEFLRGIERCALGLPKVKRTIEEIKKWVRKQVGPSLALVTMAEQGCTDWLYEVLMEGRRRIPLHRLALLPGG